MTEHPAVAALAIIDTGEITASDVILAKLRDLLEALAKLPWTGEDGPATEPGNEPDVGTNA